MICLYDMDHIIWSISYGPEVGPRFLPSRTISSRSPSPLPIFKYFLFKKMFQSEFIFYNELKMKNFFYYIFLWSTSEKYGIQWLQTMVILNWLLIGRAKHAKLNEYVKLLLYLICNEMTHFLTHIESLMFLREERNLPLILLVHASEI